jgi:hypothetical protein
MSRSAPPDDAEGKPEHYADNTRGIASPHLLHKR